MSCEVSGLECLFVSPQAMGYRAVTGDGSGVFKVTLMSVSSSLQTRLILVA